MHASCLNYTCNHVSLRIYELPLKRIDCWHKQQTNRVLIVFHGVGQSASQAAAFRHAHKVIDWEMTLVACWPRKPPATRGSRNPNRQEVPLYSKDNHGSRERHDLDIMKLKIAFT